MQDIHHHLRRARQEQEAAAKAACPNARQSHEHLARLHLQRCGLEPAFEPQTPAPSAALVC